MPYPIAAIRGRSVVASGAPIGYSISGVVYDADGTTTVSGATVALGAYSAVSAADGTYTISSIPSATAGSMTCTKTGYSWTAITVASMSGNLTAQNFSNAWWAAAGCAASCVAAYKSKGAASLAASYVNLKNPGTNDAAPGVAPNFAAATGRTYTGTQYLTTGVVPVNDQSYSAFIRSNNFAMDGFSLFGASWGSNKLVGVYYISVAGGTLYFNGSSVSNASSNTGDHVLGIVGNKAYRDGVALAGTIGTTAGSNTNDIYIGGDNLNGTAENKGKFDELAFVVYNAVISGPQAVAVSAAMAAL